MSRLTLMVLVLFSCSLCSLPGLSLAELGAQELKEKPKEPKQQTSITISPETTRIVKPLTKTGYVDYIAATNETLSKGVTPENNAAIPLLYAMGLENPEAEFQKQYYEMLKIPAPEAKPPFVELSKILDLKPDDEEANEKTNTLFQQQTAAMEKPWSTQDYPLIAQWLKANEKTLELITAATQRTRLYNPLIGSLDGETENSTDLMLAVLLPAIQTSREAARLLAARAMLRAGEGNIEGATADLLACHRLARLTGQGSTLIDGLVSIAIDSIAYQADHSLAHSGKATAKQLLAYQKQLQQLPAPVNLAEAVDMAERYLYLDAVAFLDRTNLGNLNALLGRGVDEGKLVRMITTVVEKTTIDWNIILKLGNEWYDKLYLVMSLKTHKQRAKGFAEITNALKGARENIQTPGKLIGEILKGGAIKKNVSEQIGMILVSMLLPAVEAAQEAEDRLQTRIAQTEISLALGAYHQENGNYPETLAALKPKYLAEIPDDLYSGGSFYYQKQNQGFRLYSVGRNLKDDDGRSRTDDPSSDDHLLQFPLSE